MRIRSCKLLIVFLCTLMSLHCFLSWQGPGIQRNFILEAASKMPMHRQVLPDVCDAKEADFNTPDDADRCSLRPMKIARCKSTRCNAGSVSAETHRKPVHGETVVQVWNSRNVVRTVVEAEWFRVRTTSVVFIGYGIVFILNTGISIYWSKLCS